MTSGLPLRDMIMAGWPIFSVLLSLSILSLAVMCERWIHFQRSELNARAFVETLKKTARNPDLSQTLSYCERVHKPLARITRAILSEPGDHAHRERIMHRTIQAEVKDMESYLSVLGTIGSIAPFIGLLGTVIGIVKAFHAISVSFGGGAGVVAAGIAEALVNTAMGLVVAIPAVVAYNYFTNKVRRHTQEWEIAGGEIIDWSEGKTRGI